MFSTSRRLVSKCGWPSTMCVISKISFFCRRSFRYCSSTAIALRLLLDELFPFGIFEGVGDGEDVFVASTRLIDQHHVVRRQRADLFEGLGEGVRRLERRDQTFFADGELERLDHLGVGRGLEARALRLVEVRQDWRYADVVEPGRDAVR